jgi:uncharacterized membrane protein YkgB
MDRKTLSGNSLSRFETIIAQWLAAHSILFLRMAVGIIFFWFGVIKFFPDQSSAEDLAVRTIRKISFGKISAHNSLMILATWECIIGIGCIMHKFMRLTLTLLFLQMLGTVMPLFFFPGSTFKSVPLVPTLEGQYILKNIVIIASAIVLLATVRGGKIISDPQIADQARQEEEEKVKGA